MKGMVIYSSTKGASNVILDNQTKKQSRGNCLNLFRLMACISVFTRHLNYHLNIPTPEALEFFRFIFHGVPVFFILSGFFIWKSIERTPDFKTFLKKRVLRLYPELWLCVAVEMTSIVIFYDQSVPLSKYLLFSFTQGTIFQFWTPDCLRDYGCGTPNGSLWTLPVIIQYYLFAWLFKKILSKQKFFTWILILVISVLLAKWEPDNLPLPDVAKKCYGMTLIPHCWIFLYGSFISNFHNKIMPLIMRFWYIPLLLMIGQYFVDFDVNVAKQQAFNTFFLCLFMLGFAYRYKKLEFKRNISYGVYLYHMIFVNIAIVLGFRGSLAAYGIVFVVVMCIGYLSTIWGRFAIDKIDAFLARH